MTSRIQGDLHVTGRISSQFLSAPDQSIDDAAVAADAEILAEKLEHQHRQVYEQESATTAAAETRVVHVVRGTTGAVERFEAGSVAACTGDATITVDLLKNGVSILDAAIVLDNANTARVTEAATIATPGLVAGDVLEVAVTVNAGTGALGSGVFAALTVHEEAD